MKKTMKKLKSKEILNPKSLKGGRNGEIFTTDNRDMVMPGDSVT